ncbi:MAG: lipopolysaccharide heptosyltransferase II [Candidatus Marinimicrobia bacterium]|nr:lipopolysaccharide heptosyltransferase II [Candidatus Neomarinimicrobiota bacterium]
MSDRFKKENINKILVLQTAYIGDVIVSTGILRELHKIYPQAKIDIITTPLSAELFKYNPYISKIFKFDKKNWKYINFFKLLKTLRTQNYDISFSIQSSFTSAILLYLAGINIRIGFDKQLLTTDSLAMIEKSDRHRSENIVNLLTLLDHTGKFDHQSELFLSDQEKEKASSIIRELGAGQEKLIGIAPGSVRETKKWPPSYYIELTKKLRDTRTYLFFIGGVDEAQLCDHIIQTSQNHNAKNLAGKLSLLESSALIQKMDLMITNDSAPLHMANAVNTDVFAFFGPTIKKYGFFPYREGDKIFEVKLNCRPCSLHGGASCPEGHQLCMKRIRPEKVLPAIKKKLNITDK